MDKKTPFFIHIEQIERAIPNREMRSLFLHTIAAGGAGLVRFDLSLSRAAAQSIALHIQQWLAETEGGEPPRQ